MDKGAAFTGGAGNDTYAGVGSVITSLDALDGGAGDDSLSVDSTTAINTTAAVNATIKNIESATFTSVATIEVDSSKWTGLTSLTAVADDAVTITAADSTDVVVSATDNIIVTGGADVSVTSADALELGAGATSVDIIVEDATGDVVISHSEVVSDDTGAAGTDTGATATVSVTGGATISVTSTAKVGLADNVGDVATIGAVTVQGDASTTSVSVIQTAATAAPTAAAVTAGTGKIKISNGVVSITDVDTADEVDTINSVELQNFGNSTITSNAVNTLTLKGGASTAPSGTLTLDKSASDDSELPTALTINLAGGVVGAIDGTLADEFTSINIVSSAASIISDVNFAAATSINVSGAGKTTISALSDIGEVVEIASTGAGLTLSAAIGADVLFTGGDGAEVIQIGATKKAITTGAGDDTVEVQATALGVGGSVDAGEGTKDVLSMSAANAVSASSSTTFETKISGFERLTVGALTTSGEVKLNNLDDLNYVSIGTVASGQTLTLSGAQSGFTLAANSGAAGTVVASLANDGTTDVANVSVSASSAKTVAALTLSGFETINLTTDDSATTASGIAHTVTTLTDANAKSVTVSGDAGLTLTTFTATTVTSFDASGVTKGAVSYTTGALAAAATLTGGAGGDTLNAAAAVKSVTISGGAGNDTLTGSATKASTLNGDAGIDTLKGGAAADTVDGGAGVDTFVFSSANVAEQDGSGTTDGVVINLGSTALTQSEVFTATGAYLSATGTTVAANSTAYLYSNESTTNAVVTDTLANIENATGSNLDDLIVGSDGDNVLTGAGGADVLTGGEGEDTFAFTTGSSVTSAADVITDFTATDDSIGLADYTTAVTLAGVSGTAGTTATSNVEVSSGGKVTFAAADDTLAEKLTAIAADTTDVAANEAAFFEHDGDTYIFINVGATDDLIVLSGVADLTTLSLATGVLTIG